jgi:hypothetical protein
MSGNSQGPTGFLPGMFKEEVAGEVKHSKDDAKSGKVLNIKIDLWSEISMENVICFRAKRRKRTRRNTNISISTTNTRRNPTGKASTRTRHLQLRL